MGELIYKSGKIILSFMFVILLIQIAFGDKAAQKMTLVTLLCVLIINSGTLADVLEGFTEYISVENETETETEKKTETKKETKKKKKKKSKSTVHTGAGGRSSSGGSRKF